MATVPPLIAVVPPASVVRLAIAVAPIAPPKVVVPAVPPLTTRPLLPATLSLIVPVICTLAPAGTVLAAVVSSVIVADAPRITLSLIRIAVPAVTMSAFNVSVAPEPLSVTDASPVAVI